MPIRDREGRIVAAVVVFTDITERKRVEQVREEYVCAISHDLRAPLTIILGQALALQRALERAGVTERPMRSLDAIVRSSRTMNAMIQDMVDAARVESGQLPVSPRPSDARAFLVDLKERLSEVGGAERIRIKAPEGLPPVLADPDRLERILINPIDQVRPPSICGPSAT